MYEMGEKITQVIKVLMEGKISFKLMRKRQTKYRDETGILNCHPVVAREKEALCLYHGGLSTL